MVEPRCIAALQLYCRGAAIRCGGFAKGEAVAAAPSGKRSEYGPWFAMGGGQGCAAAHRGAVGRDGRGWKAHRTHRYRCVNGRAAMHRGSTIVLPWGGNTVRVAHAPCAMPHSRSGCRFRFPAFADAGDRHPLFPTPPPDPSGNVGGMAWCLPASLAVHFCAHEKTPRTRSFDAPRHLWLGAGNS
jgi:hypothetical protein